MSFSTVPGAIAVFARDRVLEGGEQLKRQLRGLLEKREDLAEAVHEVRKRAKAVRGGLALFRLQKTSGREIQAIGRMLSGTRDAVSRQAMWERLDWQGDIRVAAAIRSLLGQQSQAVSRVAFPAAAAGWCLERVDAAQTNLRELPEAILTKSLRQGLDGLGHRVRQCCRRLQDGEEPRFHETRKALKAWMGALEHLPEGLRPDVAFLEDLTEWLGDENDLATLSGWLEEHGFTAGFAPDLWKTVRKLRHRLQRKVIRRLPPLRHLKLVRQTGI